MAAKAPATAPVVPVVKFTAGGLLMFMASLVLIPGLLLWCLLDWREKMHVGETDPAVAAYAPSAPRKELSGDQLPKQIGPWGELRVLDFEMAAPEEFSEIHQGLLYQSESAWVFEGQTLAQVKQTLARCGLDQQQVDLAMTDAQALPADKGTRIKPTDELIYSLSPAARGQLYAELARYDANPLFAWPFLFPRMGFEKNLAGETFSPGVVPALRRLLYVRGETQCFSDLALVLRLCQTESERARLVTALNRHPALVAGIYIGPGADLPALARYWSMGRDVPALRSFMESVQRLPKENYLSLAYLVPEFARSRINTFPTPGPSDPKMDCQWTAFNFFNDVPDDQLANPDYLRARLLEGCRPLEEPSLPGDILVFMDAKGVWFHSCVYIAGDVVFTKNGNNLNKPWKFMHLSDVKAVYSRGGVEPQVSTYRLKQN